MSTIAGNARPRALNLKLFSDKFQDTPSGGLIVHDVLALQEGTWHPSNSPWPIRYSAAELEKSTWVDKSVWDGHSNKSPSAKTGVVLNPRYDAVQKGQVVDVHLHGLTQKSKDLVAMIKAGAKGEIDPLWVSVEHTSNDVFNQDTQQWEAHGIEYVGLAVVDSGACRTCRLNEENKTDLSKGMDLAEPTIKQLEESIDSLKKELAEAKAVKSVPVADFETVQNENKALKESLKGLAERVEKIEKQPAPARTGIVAEEKLLETPNRDIVVKNGMVYREA